MGHQSHKIGYVWKPGQFSQIQSHFNLSQGCTEKISHAHSM